MQVFHVKGDAIIDQIHRTFTGAHLFLEQCLEGRCVVETDRHWAGLEISGFILYICDDNSTVTILSRLVRD